MIFQPVIRLHRYDEHTQVKDIFLQDHQVVGPEHFIEQHSFFIPKKSKDQIQQQQYIHHIHDAYIAFVFTKLHKHQDEDECNQHQLLFHQYKKILYHNILFSLSELSITSLAGYKP